MLIRMETGPSDAPPPTNPATMNSASQQLRQHTVASQQLAAEMMRERPELYAVTFAPARLRPDRQRETGIGTRQVAILVDNGSDGPMVRAIYKALLNDGAVPRLVGSQRGKIQASDKSVLYIEITLEAGSSVLYDAVVVPDGEAAVASLARDARALDFVREQYRYCKPIMAMGAGAGLLRQASVPPAPPADGDGLAPALAAFTQALASHRAFAGEAGPPLA